MKCVFCGADNLDNAKFCANCGKELNSNQKLEFYEKEDIEELKNQKHENTNKKSKKRLIISLCITFSVLFVLGAALTFVLSMFSPKNVFKQVVNESYKASLSEIKGDYDSIYLSLSLSPLVKGTGSKQFEDIFNKFEIKLAGGVDYNKKIVLYNFVTNYNDKEFVNAYFQYDKEFYIMLNNLYDRPIMAEESDFEDVFNKVDVKSTKTVLSSFVDAFNDSLQNNYFESGKETIMLNNKKVKARVSTLILNEKNAKEMEDYITKRLLANDDFINAYASIAGEDKDQVKASLNENASYEDFKTLKIKLYTSMWNKDLIKVKIISDDVTVEIKQSTENKDGYVISVKSGGITMAFNMKYEYVYNKKIDLKVVNNPINSEELTSDALNQILINLKNQEGYKSLDFDVKDVTTMSIEELLAMFFMNDSNASDTYSY